MSKFNEDMLLLYAVTDRAWTGKQTLLEQIESALKGGVTLVQLREKQLDFDEFVAEAIKVRELCKKYNVPLIINDNIEVALKSGADGVHVGQEDMRVADIRKLVGDDMIIGATAKTVEQAQIAEAEGADYIGVGAVFPSPTKTNAIRITSEKLKEICSSVSIPAVAIGGISKSNMHEITGGGMKGVALVSAIFAAEDIENECKLLKAKAAKLDSIKLERLKMREYKTQMEAAKKGIITPEMKIVASKEYMEEEKLRELVAKGEVAIPCNINHISINPEGIGTGLRTKINVNLGISGDCNNYDVEMQKVDMAIKYGAEAIMDLSNYGKTNTFRKELIAKSPAMIGTVPMYDAIGYLEKDLLDITAEDFLKVVEAHAKEGVDFMTIHAGINRRTVEAFRRDKRKMNIVSRGGSLLFAWMMMTGNENPFFEHYDEVLEILREYDVTISLGDALRPGCIDDATDAGQISELIELGALTERAWAKDVQVMVEGPGHMAMNEIAANMKLQKRICHNAPFYVLGPLVTDIAPGYDHITSAIGGAIAAASGADFLCYVTPAEHLRLPDVNDVKEGIMASRIAAHAADIAKGIPHATDRDNAMAEARHKVDWEEMFKLAIDGDKAREYFESTPPSDRHTCSMCGKMCAVKTTNMILEGKEVRLNVE